MIDMNFKYLAVLGLILTIITIGAVSASDNQTADDDIKININEYGIYEDSADIVTSIYSPEESGNVSVSVDGTEYFNKNISSCEKSDDRYYSFIRLNQLTPTLKVGEYNLTVKYNNHTKNGILKVDPLIEIDDYVISGNDGYGICSINDYPLNGTVKVFFDGVQCYKKTYKGNGWNGIYWENLNIKTNINYGKHNLKVIYSKNKGKTYTCEKNITYTYNFDMLIYADEKTGVYPDKTFKTDLTVSIDVPKDASKKVIVKFNGKTYKVTPSKGQATLKLKNLNLKLGFYRISATYSDSKYPKKTIRDTFSVDPSISYSAIISVGQDEHIHIIAPAGSKGSATLYNGEITSYDGDQYMHVTTKVAKSSIVNGHGAFSLKNLSKGYHKFYLNYTVDGINYGREIYIDVVKNIPEFSSSISASEIKKGQGVIVKVKGPARNTPVKIFVDGHLYKSPSMKNGKVKLAIADLSKGRHKIDIYYEKSYKYYSKTYYLTVKSKIIELNLKKVNVVRSTSKLTLKATLKIDGEKAANKKIKFKFSDKTYKVKTNRKGVAELTVSKKTLKELQAGTTVTYKASYGDVTVKHAVEVGK